MGRSIAAIVSCVVVLACSNTGVSAQAPSWSEVKCTRYKKAWSEALARMGTKGLGADFLERHDAFLASGCTTRGDVCPRAEEELVLANMMVIAAMNAGAASTFPPFACGK